MPHSEGMVPFSFAQLDFAIIGEAALFCPAERALLVADLHLEKASWYARFGQMLPPYDSHATLARLADIVARCEPAAIYCLGDNFHDDEGEERLEPAAAAELVRLMRGRRWVWVTGNHDEGLTGRWGGDIVEEARLGPIALRHEIDLAASEPEISGHFHPKLRFSLRKRGVSRRCFVLAGERLIMPAFGALTGGLDVADPVFGTALGAPEWQALAPVREQLARFSIRDAARSMASA